MKAPELLVQRPLGARAIYVLAHGAGAGMRHPFMQRMADALAEQAIATVRWEFPYMIAGKRRVDAPPIAEAAVQAAWAAARAQLGAQLPMFAGGKSFGGRMTSRAHAVAPLPGLAGLVLLGFPLHPATTPGVERAEHLAAARGRMLFVSGSRDALADLALLRPVVAALGRRAQLHVVEGADHGLERPVAALPTAAAIVARWIGRTAAALRARHPR